MVKINNKNFKLNSFTHYNVACLLYCIYFKRFYDLYSIVTCWTYTIFFTFHGGYIYDNSAFVKIRKKININFLEFHSGNFILHIIPLLYVMYYPPQILNYYHSIIALLLKYNWIYISTHGTMDLSSIYVEFDNKVIMKLYLTSSLSCLFVPFFHNKILN